MKVPSPGDVISLETGDVIVFEVRGRHGDLTVLGGRVHPLLPFATWKFDSINGCLYAGRYFEALSEAEVDLDQR